MSAQGVTTPVHRVRWIMLTTAELGDVGDGTAFALEGTLDQVIEAMARVEDAWFVAGSVGFSTGNIEAAPEATISLVAPIEAASNRTDYAGALRRGFTTYTPPVSVHNDKFLDEEYDAGSGEMYRDIDDNERGVWMHGDSGVTYPYWNFELGAVVNSFSFEQDGSGGFAGIVFHDHFSVSIIFTPTYWEDPGEITYGNPITAFVRFTGNVAVIRTDASHDVCAPTNRYFMEMEFFMKDGVEDYGVMEASTNYASVDAGASTIHHSETSSEIVKYVMRLSSGDISCPIYFYFGADPSTYPYVNGADFVHEAKSWFPYAKTDFPAPVWNIATGAKL